MLLSYVECCYQKHGQSELNVFIFRLKCNNICFVFSFREFTSYWNIPSFVCSKKFKLPTLNVTERYGIIQNAADNFR